MGSNVKNSQKRHILARVRIVWAIMRGNPLTCLTCRWVREQKGINKNNFGYISPMCPEVPRGRICTYFGTAVGVADVITCDKFFGDRLRGVDSVGEGSKIAISHWLSQWLLTQGWRYRAACDETAKMACLMALYPGQAGWAGTRKRSRKLFRA